VTEIRSLTAEDLPAIAALLDAHLSGWSGDQRFLRETVLEHPWADPELTSLVATDEGRICGFIGAQVRRLRFDDRNLRGVCCSHLVVDPEQRAGATGALLLRRLLSGPQDATWTDSANDLVARMWETFGGHLDHCRACDWMLVLRPLGWIASATGELVRRRGISSDRLPVGALPIQAIRQRATRASDSAITGQDATAAEIVDALSAVTSRIRLRVDHDRDHLGHLFELVRRRTGPLVCRLVRSGERALGWYAYLPQPSHTTRVLHLCASPRDVDAVFGELIVDARSRGTRVLVGRVEPGLDAALRSRRAVLGLAHRPAVHARDPELRATLATGSSLLTQLDSEWFVI
jgi:hypothetical protein